MLEAQHVWRRLRVESCIHGTNMVVVTIRIERGAIVIHCLVASVLVHERRRRKRSLRRGRLDERVIRLLVLVRRHTLMKLGKVHHGWPSLNSAFTSWK